MDFGQLFVGIIYYYLIYKLINRDVYSYEWYGVSEQKAFDGDGHNVK